MGAKLITTFEMQITDPAGGDTGWSFSVKVPPLEVVERLDSLHADFRAQQERAAARMAKTRAVLDSAEELDNPEAIKSNKKLIAKLMESADEDTILAMQAEPSFAMQCECAKEIEPYCSPPRGLTDDSNNEYTWKRMQADNPPYAAAVLYRAAREVLDRTVGQKGLVELKN